MSTRFRSFGLTAHVDAGKTTLAESLLFVTGRIHRPGEVRGDRPTVLDHYDVEARRGITVSAAATTLYWDEHRLALVDTPGHVDFTVEVERAMSVLDGAVLVVCGVAGAQAQTRTVERQMARYGVARIAFVNKCDHPAADPARAVETLRTRLGVHAALVQMPIGIGDTLRGVVDLVHRRAWTYADRGRTVVPCPVPPELADAVEAAREQLVDAVSLVDQALVEQVLALGEAPPDVLSAAIRRAVCARTFVPALVGSAAKGIGVQPVLDAIVAWLPAPADRVVTATDPTSGIAEALSAEGPVVAYVFKTADTNHGTWTWLRVYRGQLTPGTTLCDGRTGQKHRVGRLGRLHAAEIEPVDAAEAGDIVAAFGLDLASGTTLCDPAARCVVGAWLVPEPVVERSIALVEGDPNAYAAGLRKLVRDDPTLRVTEDAETGQTRIRGMGELHLEVAADLLHERYRVTVRLGTPAVAFRAALGRAVPFDFLLKKQTGGPGMYARLVGRVEPADTFRFGWEVAGGTVPASYRGAIERAMREEAAEGAGGDWPLVGVDIVVTDGDTHTNDSSEHAFAIAARLALRQAAEAAGIVTLEPVMRVVAEAPDVRPGVLASLLLSRGGRLTDATDTGALARVEACVPLQRMFGFSAALRSATTGMGTFAMELTGYEPTT